MATAITLLHLATYSRWCYRAASCAGDDGGAGNAVLIGTHAVVAACTCMINCFSFIAASASKLIHFSIMAHFVVRPA